MVAPGVYTTEMSKRLRVWCHLALRPDGPVAVLKFSLCHDSRDLWSVRMSTIRYPIQEAHLVSADTTA